MTMTKTKEPSSNGFALGCWDQPNNFMTWIDKKDDSCLCWTSGGSTVFPPHIHISPPPVFIPPASSLKVKQKLIICLVLQRAPAPRLLFPTLDLLAYPPVGPARTHLFKWQHVSACADVMTSSRERLYCHPCGFLFFFKDGEFHPELHRFSAHYHESNSTRRLSHSYFFLSPSHLNKSDTSSVLGTQSMPHSRHCSASVGLFAPLCRSH